MSKNPDDVKDFETMKELAHFWLRQSYCMYIEKTTLKEILKDHNIVVDECELIVRMNKIFKEETVKWEKENQSRKK